VRVRLYVSGALPLLVLTNSMIRATAVSNDGNAFLGAPLRS